MAHNSKVTPDLEQAISEIKQRSEEVGLDFLQQVLN